MGDLQPLAVAKLLQKMIEKEEPSIVLCGKQAIDGDSGQTGGMLAGLLGWPQASSTSKVTLSEDGKSAAILREVDTGIQELTISLPAVITADLRLNEPRYATLPNLMKAKKKKMEVIDCDSLGVDLKPRLEILKMEDPPTREGGVKVANVDELIDKLKNEAKVL